MKKSLIILGLLALGTANAQQKGAVGINTNAPKATLEIMPNTANAVATATTNEGILAPRLTKSRVANIAKPVQGTLVYVLDENTTDHPNSLISSYTGSNTAVANINEKGYYFYDGGKWVKAASVLPNGTANNQVLKWNGTAWTPQTDSNNTYVGSTSIFLNGRVFERAALTGDVTSPRNSNTVTINDGAVTGAKIASNTITADKLAPMGATNGQILKWNGTAWAPAADNTGTSGTILPNGTAVGDILEWDGTKWVAKTLTRETATSSFTRNIRVVSTDSIEEIQPNDYFLHLTSTNISAVTLPKPADSKGRVLCFYSENSLRNVEFTPAPKGIGQPLQPSQTACFISNGVDWINATGY